MSFNPLNYNPAYNQVSLERASSSLFVLAQGSPMNFNIPFDQEGRNHLIKYITINGGNVTDADPTEQNGVILLSSVYKPGRVCFRPEYVWDSLDKGIQLDLQGYKVSDMQQFELQSLLQQQDQSSELQLRKAASIDSNSGTSKRSFTPDEDDYILEQVRLDPRRRTSHKLFDEIAKTLSSHTGNSIRYRYRNQLERKLGYVYKTDPSGKIVKDIDGNYVRESIENLPKTLKNRFTAADDYALCLKIIDYNHQQYEKLVEQGVVNPANEPLDLDKPLTVPVSFFREMERQYPLHTRAAWRDRYRKFASKYGIKRYVDYYANTKDPQPMKDFTKRGARSLTASADQVRSLIGDVYNRQQLPIGSTSIGPTSMTSNSIVSHAIPSNPNPSNPISSDSKHDHKEQALDEEIGEVKSSNIDDALLRTQGSTTQSQLEDDNELFVDAQEGNSPLYDNEAKDGQLASQLRDPENDGRIPFTYPTSSMTLQDLLEPSFFNKRTEEEVLRVFKNATELYQGDEPGQLLATLHSELGFTDYFISVIFVNVSGDIQKMLPYMKKVVHGLFNIHNNVSDQELYKVIEVEGIDGVWNKKYDDMLESGTELDLQQLQKVHSEESIKIRRGFLSNIHND